VIFREEDIYELVTVTTVAKITCCISELKEDRTDDRFTGQL